MCLQVWLGSHFSYFGQIVSRGFTHGHGCVITVRGERRKGIV